jgi:hypothetical protein
MPVVNTPMVYVFRGRARARIRATIARLTSLVNYNNSHPALALLTSAQLIETEDLIAVLTVALARKQPR